MRLFSANHPGSKKKIIFRKVFSFLPVFCQIVALVQSWKLVINYNYAEAS